MDHILFITEGYPTEKVPRNTFIDNLVCAMADMDVACTVISPVSITGSISRREELPPPCWERTTAEGSSIRIYCPRYFTVSDWKFAGINSTGINYRGFLHAANKVIEKHALQFDAVYGHFLFPAGMAANELGVKYRVPSYFAYGENTDYNLKFFSNQKNAEMVKNICGVISVSSKNSEELAQNAVVDEKRIKVFPNAIDNARFYPRDKAAMREKYGFGENDFIVAFVGYFTEIKGPHRLAAALQAAGGSKSVFIGKGSIQPHCEGILFKGQVPHDMVPELLSAADVFVLPTLAEGCCNALIEAMACGLPVISSNLRFNEDILNSACALLIDPTDVAAISDAIIHLRDHPEARKRMGELALAQAQKFLIQTRAANILRFMDEMAQKNEDTSPKKAEAERSVL